MMKIFTIVNLCSLAISNLTEKMVSMDKYVLNQKQLASMLKLSKHGYEDVLSFINRERAIIAEYFVHNENLKMAKRPKGDSLDITKNEKIFYSLSKIRNKIGKNLSDQEILEILFYWPFRYPDVQRKSTTSNIMKIRSQVQDNSSISSDEETISKEKIVINQHSFKNDDLEDVKEFMKGKTNFILYLKHSWKS